MTRKKTPRIGVFICHCGSNIAGVVNVQEVAEYAAGLANVAHVARNLHTCSSEGTHNIREAIKAHKLNRVVVAACTPRTHEAIFREVCEEAGLNKYLFQMVNIREHDSWVHKDTARATEKAKHLVAMAVAKAGELEPQEEKEVPILPSSVVVGAGVSGMTAALALADQGFRVTLVEKDDNIGGVLRDLDTLFPTEEKASKLLADLENRVRASGNITLLTSTKVTSVDGHYGDFRVGVEGGGKSVVEVGTIIVATGAEPLKPKGLYGYGTSPSIITQIDLEKKLTEEKLSGYPSIVMIQCVGAMEERGRTYCGRVCCSTALKNALRVKELSPKSDVYILYRDLMLPGAEAEETYREALRADVKFVNYVPEKPPTVTPTSDGAEVKVNDVLLGREVTIKAGLVVLSTPLTQRGEAVELAKLLRVPLGSDGFYLEAHPKMRPVDFSSDGIFLCGTAHGPKGVSESVSQALSAAARASIPMAKGKVKAEGYTATLDRDLCVGCGACAEACPNDAITWTPLGFPEVNEATCKGCGVCSSECPMGAMQLSYFKDKQLMPALDALITPQRWLDPDRMEPVILCFACRWCSYAAADFAGVMRLSYPPNVRILMVPCSGRVDFRHILEAFRRGADGVIVTGCLKEQCHYIDGNLKAERRIEAAKKSLTALGFDGDRLEMFFCSAGMPREFASHMTEFTERVKAKGSTDWTPLFVERRP